MISAGTKLAVALGMRAAVFSLSGNAVAQERVYSVIEYLANQQQLSGKDVQVKGDVMCGSETYCTIVDEGRSVQFIATDLPEPDRIELIRSGTPGHASRKAIVVLHGSGAVKIDFDH